MLIGINKAAKKSANGAVRAALDDGIRECTGDSQADGLADAHGRRRYRRASDCKLGGVGGAAYDVGVRSGLGRDCGENGGGEDSKFGGKRHFEEESGGRRGKVK